MTSQAKALTDLIALLRVREEDENRVIRLPAAQPALAAVQRPISTVPARAPMKQAVGAETAWQEF
jgi:hypothetical protein